MNGAQLLLKTAVKSGVDICFANPGTTELPIVAALDDARGIRPILCLFEGVCAGAADGYGRMSGKPAMTLFHLGPGLCYGLPNLHNARRARTPVLVVVGEHATWHRGADPPLAMDMGALAATVSGWHRSCQSAELLSRDTAEALKMAARGKVATLMVPHDVQWTDCGELPICEAHSTYDPVNLGAVMRAADLLRKHKKVAIILGGRALRRNALIHAARIRQVTGCDLLSETLFAHMERGLGIPVIDRIPYLPEKAVAVLSRYQALILAGANEPVAFFGYKDSPSRLLNTKQVTCSIAEENENPEDVLEHLADAVGAAGALKGEGLVPGRRDRLNLPRGALTPEKAAATLVALQPEGAIIVDESVTSGSSYYRMAASAPPHSLLTLTGGALGQGMPCAVGAALACPDRAVINIEADGSAMYTVQALWTQARESLNVTTLICSNRRYEILRVEMARSGHDSLGPAAVALTDIGSPSLDWSEIAAASGVPAIAVTTAEQLAVGLKKAISEPGPHLIEMIF